MNTTESATVDGWPCELVVNGLIRRMASSPHTLTVYGEGGKVEHTHQALFGRVMATAARLRAQLGTSQRVGVVADNSIEYVIIDLACIAAGICTVCVDQQGDLQADTLAYFKALSVEVVIVGQRPAAAEPAGELRFLAYAELLDAGASQATSAEVPVHQWDELEFLTIKQTSGSTGVPKAIGATVSSIDDTLTAVQRMFEHRASDRVLIFLPLYLVQQRYWIYSSIFFGFDAILTTPKGALSVLSSARPTVVMGVPKFYDVLRERIQYKAQFMASAAAPDGQVASQSDHAHLLAAARAVLGPDIRYLWTGSAPCSHVALHFFSSLGVPLLEGYGTNETDIISKNTFKDLKLGSVGKVLPNRRVLLSDSGQISVWKRYPVTHRYELGEESTGGFEGDVFVTGDLGYIDEDGYLFIHGRVGDAFVLESGTTIHPREVEMKLEKSDLIDFAVVYGENRPYLIAIVDPSSRAIDRHALEQAVHALTAHAGSAKRVAKVVMTREPFSEANGCLSAQMKVVRRRILEQYREEIETCYSA
jgi:long-chain acyl-CoA synthetase